MKPLQQWLRRVPLGLAAAAIAAGPAAALAADAWPSRPVTIVVPFAPGGNTDMMARMMAERMSKVFGKPFIVDNKGARPAPSPPNRSRAPSPTAIRCSWRP